MKPRTSYEREVVRLSRSLPGLSGRWKCRSQRELIDYANAITFRGRKTNVEHFIVVQRKGGWQVLRHWYMYAVFKYRRLDRVEYLECMQEWMKDGHYVFMALNRQQGYCDDAWCAGQDLSIKRGYEHCAKLDDPRHLGYVATYYQSMTDTFRYLPTDDEAGVRVDWMMRAVNESSYWETVIKRDARLFAWMWKKGMADHMEKAAAVKVALRYGQNVKDDDWVDLVDMLFYLGKDLHNPIYVAPRDFKKMHDEISQYKLISVDDIGTETVAVVYGESHDYIQELIDLAERKQKLLIITTNLNIKEVGRKYGDRTVDRLRALTKCVIFEGESLRGRKL